jgi:tetratricopeptide (TPR) repeat protein/tRNA A-37 threonylcarbamoyl transferase component Bud32
MEGKEISHYRILEKLGEGGMGVVYKAEDTSLKRTVALKFLHPDAAINEEQRQRFIHEAQAAAAIEHPNICTVYEIGREKDQIFISMAYLEGTPLDEKLRSGPLSLEEILNLAIQVGGALSEAHAKQVIHRDLKSANIMVTPRGEAKILDFGLAKRAGQADLTQQDTSMGTVAYMSPEQTRGDVVDARTDIWSFGVMLYEMVAGKRPFRGDYDQAIIYSILNEEPEPLSDLQPDAPPELVRIIHKALAKDPESRYLRTDDILEDLRGLRRQIEGSDAQTRIADVPAPALSPMRDLLNRRVPQILGIYVLAAFVITAFLGWLVDRYPLSPNLPDFALILMAAMVPTVLLLAYLHGRPGRHPWKRVEAIGVPLNAVAAVAVLAVMFQGRDLGAATKKVTYTDDEGQLIEREIPKSEFRKRLALFHFENESGDATHNWLRQGLPAMMSYDLEQDMYLVSKSGFSSALREAGYPAGWDVPLVVKMKIARERHYRHVCTGSFTVASDTVRVLTALYETGAGKRVATAELSGTDVLDLVDELSSQIKKDLGIPAYHIERTEDFPVRERLTESVPAARAFYQGLYAWRFEEDLETGVAHMEEAIRVDPSFALAHAFLSDLYWVFGKAAEGAQSLRSALQFSERLPESYRYWIKYEYHFRNEDLDAALEHAKDWVRLFPESVEAHEALVFAASFGNDPDLAISECQVILELDPGQYNLWLTIANLYSSKGEYGEARKYAQMYADQFPDQYKSHTALGDIDLAVGDFEGAKANFEKARRIELEEISILRRLADLEMKMGDFKAARDQLELALEVSKTAVDRAEIYGALVEYYKITGEIGRALENVEKYAIEYSRQQGPLIGSLLRTMSATEPRVMVGKEDAVLSGIRNLEKELADTPFLRMMPTMAYCGLYRVLEDPATIPDFERAVLDFEVFMEKSQMELYRPHLLLSQAALLALKGKHEEAIEKYQAALDVPEAFVKTVPKTSAYVGIAKSYRGMKAFDDAERVLADFLATEPFEPVAHYELALIYHEKGQPDKALEHLRTALRVWEDADPEFRPAIEARARLTEWQTRS